MSQAEYRERLRRRRNPGLYHASFRPATRAVPPVVPAAAAAPAATPAAEGPEVPDNVQEKSSYPQPLAATSEAQWVLTAATPSGQQLEDIELAAKARAAARLQAEEAAVRARELDQEDEEDQ